MEDKVFYIVGKITGDKNYKTKFYNAYKFLTEKTGYSKVISPTCTPDNLPYECYAPISIGFVQACDCLFVLRDWKESKGARAGVACKNLKRDFIGIELDKDYFKIAEERINNA